MNSLDQVIELIKSRRLSYMYALAAAQSDAPLEGDEYYESDAYYEGAIEVLTDLLKEINTHLEGAK